jgi:hypothetical protein
VPAAWQLHEDVIAGFLNHVRKLRAMARLAILRLFVLLATLVATCVADAADLRITALELFPEGSLKLTFEDSGTDTLNYVPLSRTNVLSDGQLVLSRISEISQGQFQTTLPSSASFNEFFQVIAFSAPDVDADGVSDALEGLLNTSTNTFDTDGDGYGDANEIQNASDPLGSESVPQLIKVNFAATQSSAKEGDGVHQVQLTFSRAFSGQIRYRVSHLSTASATTDFAVTGIVDVNGTTAVIPIPLLDDLVIENVEFLVLDLEADPEKYLPGGASRHTVLLYDNDNYWSGVLRNENTEHAFRLRLLRHATMVEGALVSSLDTNSTTGVNGVGTIPPGTWSLTTAQLTSTHFEAVSVPIPVGASTLFGSSTLNRVLKLVAKPDQSGSNPGTNYWIKPNLIMGTYTDTLSPSSVDLGYLRRETTGVFVLIEDLPILPVPETGAAAAFNRKLTSTLRPAAP